LGDTIHPEPVDLEAAIGFQFRNRDLLIRALTHASHRGESGQERVPQADNEQLEFLGDAVLGLIVSEYVIRMCPDFDEGRLSNVKSRLVNRAHLANVARNLRIGEHMVMGKAEDRSGGREKASLLANAAEALLAAVYLDGGLEPVRRIVLTHVIAGEDMRALATASMNNIKTNLEIMARQRDLPKPEYSVRAEHAGYPQAFVAEVRVGKDLSASGRGRSKKNAEMEAARNLVLHLETVYEPRPLGSRD
jgi:ribonuclease-3